MMSSKGLSATTLQSNVNENLSRYETDELMNELKDPVNPLGYYKNDVEENQPNGVNVLSQFCSDDSKKANSMEIGVLNFDFKDKFDVLNCKSQNFIPSDCETKKVHACQYCNFVATNKEEFVNHLSCHENVDINTVSQTLSINPDQNPYITKILTANSKNEQLLDARVDNLYSVDNRRVGVQFSDQISSLSNRNESSASGSHICDKCHQQFKTKQKLTHHGDVHDSKKKFRCHYTNCERRFRSKKYLNNHLPSHTGQKKVYYCKFHGCTLEFKHKTQLKSHRQNDHPGYKVYQCSYSECQMSFDSEDALKQHLHTHNNGREITNTLQRTIDPAVDDDASIRLDSSSVSMVMGNNGTSCTTTNFQVQNDFLSSNNIPDFNNILTMTQPDVGDSLQTLSSPHNSHVLMTSTSYSCHICTCHFESQSELNVHIYQTHDLNMTNQGNLGRSPDAVNSGDKMQQSVSGHSQISSSPSLVQKSFSCNFICPSNNNGDINYGAGQVMNSHTHQYISSNNRLALNNNMNGQPIVSPMFNGINSSTSQLASTKTTNNSSACQFIALNNQNTTVNWCPSDSRIIFPEQSNTSSTSSVDISKIADAKSQLMKSQTTLDFEHIDPDMNVANYKRKKLDDMTPSSVISSSEKDDGIATSSSTSLNEFKNSSLSTDDLLDEPVEGNLETSYILGSKRTSEEANLSSEQDDRLNDVNDIVTREISGQMSDVGLSLQINRASSDSSTGYCAKSIDSGLEMSVNANSYQVPNENQWNVKGINPTDTSTPKSTVNNIGMNTSSSFNNNNNYVDNESSRFNRNCRGKCEEIIDSNYQKLSELRN